MASIEDFGKLDLRVADVVGVRDHPNADKLMILDIDLGGERRQIVELRLPGAGHLNRAPAISGTQRQRTIWIDLKLPGPI